MTINAKIIADSISPEGIRLTTMQLRYPRAIHAEFMTHRVFSRNASSSRAIPVDRLIQDVLDDPFIPVSWGKNQKGMQAGEELSGDELARAKNLWMSAMNDSLYRARDIAKAGAHKQIVNRLLEPFAHINVVVTATEWSNFFALRDHPDAEPHIQILAWAMRKAQEESEPQTLQLGEWHLPYVTNSGETRHILAYCQDRGLDFAEVAIKISVARCARVSYLTHEGKTPEIASDLELYDRLVAGVPLHASPAEHQATPDDLWGVSGSWDSPKLHGNLRGWIQYRKTLQGECQ